MKRLKKSVVEVRSYETRDIFIKLACGIVGFIVICIGLYGLLKRK